jgi:hypothetical protein
MPETSFSDALDMAHGLIQEAKGRGDGYVVDHLDAAEGWLDKAEAIVATQCRMVKWVGQQHKNGCMAAVAAMILGLDYDAGVNVLTDNPAILETSAFGYFTLESQLADRGYAIGRKYAMTQPGNKPRAIWPPEPWADVHWCEVMAGAASGYAHAVVMLGDGTILDPMSPEPRRLSDYEKVNFVAAVVKVTSSRGETS